MRWTLRCLLALLGLGVVLVLVWYLAVPGEFVEDRIEGLLEATLLNTPIGGVDVEVEGVRKTPLFGLRIESITVSGKRPLITLYRLQGGIQLQKLLAGRVEAVIKGELEEGSPVLLTLRMGGGKSVYVEVPEAGVEDLPILQEAGLKGEGVFSLRGLFRLRRTLEGTAVLKGRDLKLSDISMKGGYIPLGLFHTLRGALRINSGVVEVTSLGLEGDRVYSRIKGVLRGGRFIGQMEVFPEPGFSKLLLAPLERYRVSDYHYRIPLDFNLLTTS